VKDAKRTYVLGIGLALLMTIFSYLIPVATNAGVDPDWAGWQDGSLAEMASTVAPWLGVWVVVGAVLAQLGNGLTMLASSSRVLWQMAHRRMLPLALGHSSLAFGTPVRALWAQAVTTAILMSVFDFRVLVVYDTFFNNVSLVLETAAFLRLRYTEANTHRPFTVPGGLSMAWALTLSKAAVLAFAFGTVQMWEVWLVAGVANVLIVAGWFVVTACRRAELQDNSGNIQPADEDALLLSTV
jgi:amino acid transporter